MASRKFVNSIDTGALGMLKKKIVGLWVSPALYPNCLMCLTDFAVWLSPVPSWAFVDPNPLANYDKD